MSKTTRPRSGPFTPPNFIAIALLLLGLVTIASAEKTLVLPMRTDGPNSLDPVEASTVYDSKSCVQIYEQLVQYKYLVDPPTLEPLLLTQMPTASKDGKTYTFELKRGVHFHDNNCFPGGKGRELIVDDVFYSWRRLVDPQYTYENEWLIRETIVGFDEYRDAQKARVASGAAFDYNAQIAGFDKIDDRHFRLHLKKPTPAFLYKLAMTQFSIVPHEAVEHYSAEGEFKRNPVGTGPFLLESWKPGQRIVFKRNPNYHECRYPSEATDYAKERAFDKAAGQRLPIVDRIEMPMFVEDQPLWLKFDVGELDYIQVPADYFDKAFLKRSQKLRKSYRKRGITAHVVPLLDFIFRGFNMEDPLLGGYTDEKRALRQAICMAIDWQEFNDAFYNRTATVYDGPIPPNLAGYPKDGYSAAGYHGPDTTKAAELLAKAGYPNGDGLPDIDYWTAKGGNASRQVALLTRQLGKVGIKLRVHLVDFSALINKINKKQGQFFSFAWGSDYPDAENNLALFYGPNEAPGANHYNYKNTDYDHLFEKVRTMADSPERTRLYEKMRDMILHDAPYAGSMARNRFYIVQPWLKNFKPNEVFYNWMKYLDVGERTSD